MSESLPQIRPSIVDRIEGEGWSERPESGPPWSAVRGCSLRDTARTEIVERNRALVAASRGPFGLVLSVALSPPSSSQQSQAEAPALQRLLLLLLPPPSRSPRLLRVGREPWFKSVGARSGQRNKRAGTSGSGRVVSFHPPKRPRPALSSSVSSVGEGGVSAVARKIRCRRRIADTMADGHFCLG